MKENVWRTVTALLTKAKNTKGTGLVPRLTATRSQVEDLVTLLDTFEEATNSLQGDGVTSSVVIPAILGIDALLAESSTSFNTFKVQLRSALQRRFEGILSTSEYVIATLLDPRYKLIPFNCSIDSADDDSATLTPVQSVSTVEAKRMLLECMRAMDRRRILKPTTITSAVKATDSSAGRRSIFDKFAMQSQAVDQSEDTRYFAISADPGACPEQYWISAQEDFPCLAGLARR